MKIIGITGFWGISILSILLGILSIEVNSSNIEEQVFYIKLSEKEIEVFDSKLAGIKVGQAWKDIFTTLGSPDYEVAYAGKKTSEQKGILRVYYLAKLHRELENEIHDKSIRLYFSNDNILKEVVRVN